MVQILGRHTILRVAILVSDPYYLLFKDWPYFPEKGTYAIKEKFD
jgi:hypothetical protein